MSSSSEENYEDDFEASKELQPTEDKKVTIPNPSSKPPRQMTSPKASISSKPNYNPNLIFQTEHQPQKKSIKSLEKENQQLKSELQALNDRISSLLNKKSLLPSKPQPKKSPKSPKDPSTISQQKLQNYELEYLRLQQIYKKFNDPDCLINLKNSLKSQKNSVDSLEKDLKKLKISIESKQKNIKNYDEVDIPGDKNVHKQLITENIKVIEQIETLEKNLEKIAEKREKTALVEEDLKEKFEKLSNVAEKFIVENEAGTCKNRELYEDKKKILDGIFKVMQASLTQLRIKEHDLKNEDSRLDQELSKYSEWLKEKDRVLVRVRSELDDVMQMASSSKLDQLAGLLKGFGRPGSVIRSLSPRNRNLMNYELRSDQSNKKITGSPLRNSLENRKNAENNSKISEDNKNRKKWGSIDEGTEKKIEENKGSIEKAHKVTVKTDEKLQINNEKSEKFDAKTEKLREITKNKLSGIEIDEKEEEKSKKPDTNNIKEVKITEEIKKTSKKSVKRKDSDDIPEEIEEKVEKKQVFDNKSDEKHKKEVKKLSILDELEESVSKKLDFLEEKPFLSEVKYNNYNEIKPSESKVPAKTYEINEVQDLDDPIPYTINPLPNSNPKIPSEPHQEPEEPNIFSSIPLSNPKSKRNRDHLLNKN